MASIGMAVILLSGTSIAMPFASAQTPHSGTMKIAQTSPDTIINGMNIDVPSNFDYFKELNKEFSDKIIVRHGLMNNSNDNIESMNEGAVYDALKKGNYEEWKQAVTNLAGYPEDVEPINKDEFNILVQLRQK